MSKFKTIIPVIICLLFCFSCDRKKDYNCLISKDYNGFAAIADTTWHDISKWQDVKGVDFISKDLTFYFDMKVPIDLTSIDCDFLISTQDGIVYKGPFKKCVVVKDFPIMRYYCQPRHDYVHFILIDHTNRLVYQWSNKELYPLYEKDEFHIKLYSNGEFDIDIPAI